MGGALQRHRAPLGNTVGPRKEAYDFRFGQPEHTTDETWWEYHRRQQNPGRAFMRTKKGEEEALEGITTDFHPDLRQIGTEVADVAGSGTQPSRRRATRPPSASRWPNASST